MDRNNDYFNHSRRLLVSYTEVYNYNCFFYGSVDLSLIGYRVLYLVQPIIICKHRVNWSWNAVVGCVYMWISAQKLNR